MERNKHIRDPNTRLKALMVEAEKHEIEIGIPIKLYFRAAQNLLNCMYSYLDDQDVESAYILASKFSILFVELLPKHPDYRTLQSEVMSKWKKEVNKTLKGAEKMKQMILEEYVKQEDEMKKKDEIEAEIIRKKEEEKKFLAEKMWLEEQENKIKCKENKDIENLQNFLSGTNIVAPKPLEIDRSLKPTSFGIAVSEANNPYNWRTLEVPKTLFVEFLKRAETNTKRNTETCGILCGKIASKNLLLTTVILPKQNGNSDSCFTECEEEIYEHADKNGLITLGWIHTHPTQTAFLSSVDLHTQFSYQIMLPEAVAIVCSPKYNQNAFFSLTPNFGLDFIKNCRSTGFHPHPTEPKLFEESPHIRLNDRVVEFCDFR